MSTRIDPDFPMPKQIRGQNVLADLLTPFTDEELIAALFLANMHALGFELGRAACAILAAQIKLEIGNGAHCHHYNLGNVKGSDNYLGDVTYFRCNEIVNGKVEWFDPYNLQTRFRAFSTLGIGAEQQIRFLGTATRGTGKPNRYQAAWDAAMAGDVRRFVEELKRAGYFTANLDPYMKAVTQIFAELMQKMPAKLAEVVPADLVHMHDPIMLQPTTGHSRFSNEDLQASVEKLQIPLVIDWAALQSDRDDIVREP